MKIGIISDTHDRVEYTSAAIQLLVHQGVECLFHCGDIESVETIAHFAALPSFFVFGNWDYPAKPLETAIEIIGGKSFGEWGEVELLGKRIAWTHSHIRGRLKELETSNLYDYVFYGHTHKRESHRTGKTLVANPGAMTRTPTKTVAIVDLLTEEIVWREVLIEQA